MSTLDDELGEGHDPTEEVGPQGADAPAKQCEFRPGELDAPPQDSQFSTKDEVSEPFTMEPTVMVAHPEDGLPTPADESTRLALAAKFGIDTVVCLEDDRQFVEMFEDEVEARDRETPIPWGDAMAVLLRKRFQRDGDERERLTFDPDRVVKRFGAHFVQLSVEESADRMSKWESEMQGSISNVKRGDRIWVAVKPVRERCKHYRRQVFSNDDMPDPNDRGHFIMYRNCLARRSVGGALMSLRDEAVYACEYRDPPHPASVEKHLDTADRLRMAPTEEVPLFNLK